MEAGIVSDIIIRLKAEVLVDKKKSAMMGGLLAVVLFMGAKALSGGETPRTANAVSVAAATDTDEGELNPDSYGAIRSRELTEYLETLDTTVSRDLFAAELASYPVVQTLDESITLNKSAAERADNSVVLARMRREAAIRNQAQRLTLQSTMTGGFPSAIINGRVIAQGQVIEGFIVRLVQPGSCVVTRGDVKITLTMAQ